MFTFHINGERFAGSREDKEEREEEEQAIVGSAHMVVREIRFVEEEEERKERTRARERTEGEGEECSDVETEEEVCNLRRWRREEGLESIDERKMSVVDGVIVGDHKPCV